MPDLGATLASLPLEVLETIPGLPPPPGIVPDFEHPTDISGLIIGVSSTAIAISTIMFAIRCYNVFFITRKVKWADLTCTLGYLFILPEYVGIVWGCLDGPMGKHQYEVHLSDIAKPSWTIGSSYLNVVFVGFMLLFVKATFFLMYLEIFHPFRWMRICCYVGGTVCSLFYLSTTIAQFVLETPRPGESWLYHSLSGDTYKSISLSVPSSAVGLVFDLYLLILPFVAVSQLNMPLKKKVGTLMLFATGILAIVGSILGVYFRQRINDTTDQLWTSVPAEIVSVYEGCFGLICVCMPSAAKVAKRHNLLKKVDVLYSKLTGLITIRPLLRSSTRTKSQETEDDGIALSPVLKSYKTVAITSAVTNVEDQQEKGIPYSVHIGAHESF